MIALDETLSLGSPHYHGYSTRSTIHITGLNRHGRSCADSGGTKANKNKNSVLSEDIEPVIVYTHVHVYCVHVHLFTYSRPAQAALTTPTARLFSHCTNSQYTMYYCYMYNGVMLVGPKLLTEPVDQSDRSPGRENIDT